MESVEVISVDITHRRQLHVSVEVISRDRAIDRVVSNLQDELMESCGWRPEIAETDFGIRAKEIDRCSIQLPDV